jgi:hypothetical protein
VAIPEPAIAEVSESDRLESAISSASMPTDDRLVSGRTIAATFNTNGNRR